MTEDELRRLEGWRDAVLPYQRLIYQAELAAANPLAEIRWLRRQRSVDAAVIQAQGAALRMNEVVLANQRDEIERLGIEIERGEKRREQAFRNLTSQKT